MAIWIYNRRSAQPVRLGTLSRLEILPSYVETCPEKTNARTGSAQAKKMRILRKAQVRGTRLPGCQVRGSDLNLAPLTSGPTTSDLRLSRYTYFGRLKALCA